MTIYFPEMYHQQTECPRALLRSEVRENHRMMQQFRILSEISQIFRYRNDVMNGQHNSAVLEYKH